MTDMTTKQKRQPSRKPREEAAPTEADKVAAWNVEQINKLFASRGLVMPAKQVDAIVKARNSHHDVRALLDKGCDPDTVVKILT